MSIPSLPQETTDLVLDALAGDSATLRSCSLVCQSWLPRSRANLHRRATFAIFKRKQSGPNHALERKMDVYRSGALAGSVRELTIKWSPYGSQQDWDKVLAVLRLFKTVRSLTFMSIDRNVLDGISERLLPVLTTQYGGLESLSLTRFSFEKKPMDFFTILRCFQQLRRLGLATVTFGRTARKEESVAGVGTVSLLRNLTLYRCKTAQNTVEYCDTLEWLLGNETDPEGRDRYLVFHHQRVEEVNSVLRGVGKSLRSLTICDIQDDRGDLVDLSTATRLRSLEVRPDPYVYGGSDLRWLAKALAKASCPGLAQLTVHVGLQGPGLGHFDTESWEALDGALSSPAFHSLETVILRVSVFVQLSAIERSYLEALSRSQVFRATMVRIRQCMRSADRRGILHIVAERDDFNGQLDDQIALSR